MPNDAASKVGEIRFEDAIEHALIATGGYAKGAAVFDAEAALFRDDVLAFVQATQKKPWAYLESLNGARAGEVLIDALVKELNSKTALTVLREGFKCQGRTFRLAFFKPNTGMNPDALADYERNRLCVYRQVHHSPKEKAQSLDMVLAVNGLPVVTLELKNPMTGQTVEHAKRQYKFDRNPNDPIFAFKKRSLVHFAVDTDEAWMTTKLGGKSTFFLPFNKGNGNRAGNPPAEPGKYKTSYLWEEILARDSLMDILARFLHLQVEERKIVTATGIKNEKRETMIFPRFHQLDAVRKLVSHAGSKGSGHNYLIQHSAGSGKSNTIAWLAHRLASLHDAHDAKVFDSVVVITDRRVLDQQLQDTVYQFDHKQGVVEKIDENTQQLAKALSTGVPIIISTIQKFPFIAKAIDTLSKKGEEVHLDTMGKRYAVIVDEAHSSQSGETAAELRRILNKSGIAEAIADQMSDMDEEELSDEAKEKLLAEMLKRPRQPNLSFFAFTATPKFKTLAVFNEPGPGNRPPFHHYSMRQAIEEGFILDVLKNYTTYATYYGLVKHCDADPNVPKKKSAKALSRFLKLHPYNIRQKVEVIVEHFRHHTKHRIGGRAKAMVVTDSRKHAVRYKLAFDKYVMEKGYKDIRSLVAFSGTVTEDDGSDFTEIQMNKGIKESELPERFASDDYQVLLVAEKYQTGFDQPLLHTMYVDKRLAGIQAVQTLSRLNRTTSGKDETFVLDFVNDASEIHDAFKPFYEVTDAGEHPDPQRLNELHHELTEARVFDSREVTEFCEFFFTAGPDVTPGSHAKMSGILDAAVTRFMDLEEEEQDAFRGKLQSFRNLYGFLSQVIPYQDSDLEKLYVYARYLQPRIRPEAFDSAYRIEDDVALKYYKLQKMSEQSIDLSDGESEPLKGPSDVGTGKSGDEDVTLSSLIEQLNDRFGTAFTKADQIFFDQVAESAIEDEKVQTAAQANSFDGFAPVFGKMLEKMFIDRMEGNEAIFRKLMEDEQFRANVEAHLAQRVYRDIRQGT